FGFCRKKPKKAHKTTTDESVNVRGKGPYDPDLPNLKFIDEFDPITLEAPKGRQSMLDEPFISETDGIIIDKVTGFSRRENNSSVSGWYIRPYEEDYEDMIKVNFIPYREYYERKQHNAHKQGDPSPPIPKALGKHKFTEKQRLRKIKWNDEICQKPKDLLCTDPEKDTKTKSKSNVWYSTSEEIYEKNKHLLCTNPEETKEAEKLMNEAVGHLEQYATSIDGYESLGKSYDNVVRYYKKKNEDHTDVLKANLTFEDPNKYDALLGILWDPDCDNLFNNGFVKIARVYNPNLVMIQQRYKKGVMSRQKYFYALLKKARISEDATIIVMTSANINDHNPSKNEYKNTIIENANLFTTDIDSEDDIRKGKLKKVFVNIAGYLIENKNNHINITYVESINGHASF
ncbi:Acidic phosphoprotein precursor PCEMA1, putative, partial [Plasmodium chabaudi adami]